MKKIWLFFLLFLYFSACTGFPEEEVKKAKLEIEALYYYDVPKYLPEEWGLMRDVWEKIDEAERKRDKEAALRWYFYVIEKSPQLEEKVNEKRKEEEELLKQKKIEEKKNLLKAERKEDDEKKEVIIVSSLPKEEKKRSSFAPKKKSLEDVRYKIEKRFPSFYTVREEESLEEIAELPLIYNDRYYWPLIYKSNRNQLRDPKRLYKGQILKIPRNITYEDIYKAREEAKAKSPRILPKSAFTPEKYKKYIEELLAEE